MQPTLPAEVLDQLAPVLASLDVEVRQAVTTVAHNKVAHAGKVILRANGTGGGYERGFNTIMDDVFNGAPVPGATTPGGTNVTAGIDERNCSCDQCTDSTCDGECDMCDDYDCTHCHNTESCCGWCSACSDCHDVDTNSVRFNSQDTAFCISCEHFCND